MNISAVLRTLERPLRKAFPASKKTLTRLTRATLFLSTVISGQAAEWTHSPVWLKKFLRVIWSIPPLTRSRVHIDVDNNSDIFERCREVWRHYGVWPISFSLPYPIKTKETPTRRRIISRIVPGGRYRFYEYADYLNEYETSCLAITHKKAGWDCFRHLEIVFSGAVPVFPDSALIPPATMVHYPKEAFAEVWRALPVLDRKSIRVLGERLRNYSEKNLSAEAMARYLLKAAGIFDHHSLLFVDESLPTRCDYLSVFTLIGLKQVRGLGLDVLREVPYIYEDWKGNPVALYGRGFGYVKGLPSAARSFDSNQNVRDFDFVIVGDYRHNEGFVDRYSSELGSKLVILDGGDVPHNVRKLQDLSRQGATVFVREISWK